MLTGLQLYGPDSGAPALKHNIRSIISDLDGAVGELDASIQKLEKEEADLLQSLQQTVGAMSDLRYGRLANGQLSRQILDGLQTVQETCESRRR